MRTEQFEYPKTIRLDMNLKRRNLMSQEKVLSSAVRESHERVMSRINQWRVDSESTVTK